MTAASHWQYVTFVKLFCVCCSLICDSESWQKRTRGRVARGLGAHWGWGLRENFLNFQVKKCMVLCIFIATKLYLWPETTEGAEEVHGGW